MYIGWPLVALVLAATDNTQCSLFINNVTVFVAGAELVGTAVVITVITILPLSSIVPIICEVIFKLFASLALIVTVLLADPDHCLFLSLYCWRLLILCLFAMFAVNASSTPTPPLSHADRTQNNV